MEQPSTATRQRVGEPVQEVALTTLAQGRAADILPPGPGRSLFVLLEPELGRGRPDIILLAISSTALDAFTKGRLRLPSLTAARALDLTVADSDLGVTDKYARQLRRELLQAGWDLSSATRKPLVGDSIAIEAKVKDWNQALRQAAKYRDSCHRTALIMPPAASDRVSRAALEFHGLGLLESNDAEIAWRVPAPRRPLRPAIQFWLIELLTRGLENGTAYRFSSSAKPSKASRNVSTREA